MHKFKPLVGFIASSQGLMYMANPYNNHLQDPCFYIGLDISSGWPSALKLKGLAEKLNIIFINYEHIPVQCKFCLSLNDKVMDCMVLKLNGVNEAHFYGKQLPKLVAP